LDRQLVNLSKWRLVVILGMMSIRPRGLQMVEFTKSNMP